jgi:NTP pyrophosphatase (non-canonical NTP hydrolase)
MTVILPSLNSTVTYGNFKSKGQRMNLNEYQKLASVTAHPAGSLTVARFIAESKQLNTRMQHLFNEMSELDFDNIKRKIFYAESGLACGKELGTEVDFVHGFLGLITEIYEMMQIYLEEETQNPTHLKEELGDLLWYIALIARSHELTLDDICVANIEKLKARYPNKFTAFDALNRDLEAELKALDSNKPITEQIDDMTDQIKKDKRTTYEKDKPLPRTQEGY